MKYRKTVWTLCAAALTCLVFEAGVAVGEKTAPVEAHGVTVGAPSILDLGPELDSLDGRQLRIRVITFQPGGAVPLHSHNGRPGIATVLQGTLTEHLEGKGVFERQQGDRLIEDKYTVHWAENLTDQTVVVLAADIYKP